VCDIGCHGHSLTWSSVQLGMTSPTDLPSTSAPPARPDWLTEEVWPFPISTIDLDGCRVAFTDTGGPGPVVLFCHLGMWSLLWRDVMVEMAPGHRCVTFDTPGVGLSSPIGPSDQTLATAARAIGALIDVLDLHDIALVVHDLGGLAALAAANGRIDRVDRIAVVNAFAWRPRGVMLPIALRVFGSSIVRELSAFTGWLPRGSSTRFGVGRHMPKTTRRAWRAGLASRSARRVPHRLFADAARNRGVHSQAEAALAALDDRPILTIFGQLGDYLRFQRQWRQRRPDLTPRTIRRGLHFPMCDDPAQVAAALREWLGSST
jgi:pimeloyl-ACP methyl ester carboxylesterase